jgi:hypothetical protein
MNDPEWTTINDAALRTGKSRRTVFRLIAQHRLDTATEAGMTLVRLPALRSAIARTKRGRPFGSAGQR